MKYIITESQYNKAIDKFISSQFEPHEEKTTSSHPKTIFWVKDGEVIVEIEDSIYVWVKESLWKIISDMFSLGYDETRQVILIWLKEHYSSKGILRLSGKGIYVKKGSYSLSSVWNKITNWDN